MFISGLILFIFQKVGIYTDKNGHGTFSCTVKNKNGRIRCEMVGTLWLNRYVPVGNFKYTTAFDYNKW